MKKQPILILKTITYRLLGSVITAIIVFCFSKKLEISIGAGVAELIIKPIFYYIHELAWFKALKRSK